MKFLSELGFDMGRLHVNCLRPDYIAADEIVDPIVEYLLITGHSEELLRPSLVFLG